MAVDRLSEQWAGIPDYGRQLRAPARALWTGVLSYDQAFDAMMVAIDGGLRRAWAEGAAQCGFAPDEFTGEETLRLEQAIQGQYSYIAGFLIWVEQNSKANKGAWGAVAARVELWTQAYAQVAGQAAAISCADRKMLFVMGETSDHCRSCLGFSGRVYRYSVWAANGAIPPNSRTECKGFRCLCTLEETDEPITRGPFPAGLLV